jgi:hypothetical protein
VIAVIPIGGLLLLLEVADDEAEEEEDALSTDGGDRAAMETSAISKLPATFTTSPEIANPTAVSATRGVESAASLITMLLLLLLDEDAESTSSATAASNTATCDARTIT